MVETIQWTDAGVVMIDQTRLPCEQSFVTCCTLL
jgi:methylthioribose-1-phosphate isomerase